METKKQMIGMFFEIDGKKYVTEIDYRSKGGFQKLIEGFSKNVKLDHPNSSDNFKFIPVDYLLNDAYEKLSKKQKANKLIINLMARNSCKIYN